jgi:hypothetical protein
VRTVRVVRRTAQRCATSTVHAIASHDLICQVSRDTIEPDLALVPGPLGRTAGNGAVCVATPDQFVQLCAPLYIYPSRIVVDTIPCVGPLMFGFKKPFVFSVSKI